MSSSRYLPITTFEEAAKFTVRVGTKENNPDRVDPKLSEVLELTGSWWDSAKIRTSERPPGWIWFHLPTVNKRLLSELVGKLQAEGIIPPWESDNWEERDWIVSFLDETFAGEKIVELPRFDRSNESGDATFSIAMNFLDSEDSATYHEQGNKIMRQQLAQKDLDNTKNLIISRSLDESSYITASDEDDLNHDQVVFRYYQHYRDGNLSCKKPKEDDIVAQKKKNSIKSRILMVSPLRLWKIGRGKTLNDETLRPASQAHVQEDVVITAFPAGYEENSDAPFSTFGNVYQQVMNPRPQNTMEVVSKIMASLVTIIDPPYYAGLNESLLTMFEYDTSAQMAKQLDIFKKFQRFVAARVTSPDRAREGLNTLTSEVECFRIVMDIRDELAMISSIFSEQERAIQTVMRTMENLMEDSAVNASRDHLQGAELGIALWKKRMSNVDQRAQVIEKALSHLLSLKVDVSNLAEAEDSKRLLGSIDELLGNIDELQQSNRALQNKADRQSKYLFAFTVVTVIYAPLSFVTSFFAIPSRDFPQDGAQDGGVSWSQRQIGGGLATSLVITIALAVLPIVLKRFIEKKRDAKKEEEEDTLWRMEEQV